MNDTDRFSNQKAVSVEIHVGWTSQLQASHLFPVTKHEVSTSLYRGRNRRCFSQGQRLVLAPNNNCLAAPRRKSVLVTRYRFHKRPGSDARRCSHSRPLSRIHKGARCTVPA